MSNFSSSLQAHSKLVITFCVSSPAAGYNLLAMHSMSATAAVSGRSAIVAVPGVTAYVGTDNHPAPTPRSAQPFPAADDHAACFGLDADHVERRAHGDAQSLPLTDGEVLDSGMAAEDAAA